MARHNRRKERDYNCPTCGMKAGQSCYEVAKVIPKKGYHAARFHVMRAAEEEEFQRKYGQREKG